MTKDIELFNELIKDELPDVEVDETLFAFYCDTFTVVIIKAAETDLGFEKKSVYKLFIDGELKCTRFINNKENVLIKAHLLINDYYHTEENEAYEENEYIEYVARTVANATEYED